LTEREPAEAAQLIWDAFEELPSGAMFGRAACVEALAAVAEFLQRPDDAARLANIARAQRTAAGASPIDEPDRGGSEISPAEAGATIRSFIASIA
jgi:hypothetical protein